MILLLLASALVLETVHAATTVPPVKILYDAKHHKAMIVRGDGCYEYHMNHQDSLDSQNDATRAVLEARMLSELTMAINIQETGHHHIDHMTDDIKNACAALPVYSWEIPMASTMSPVTTS